MTLSSARSRYISSHWGFSLEVEGGVGGRDAGGVVLNLIKNICSRLGSFKTFNLYKSIKVVFPIILNYNHVL